MKAQEVHDAFSIYIFGLTGAGYFFPTQVNQIFNTTLSFLPLKLEPFPTDMNSKSTSVIWTLALAIGTIYYANRGNERFMRETIKTRIAFSISVLFSVLSGSIESSYGVFILQDGGMSLLLRHMLIKEDSEKKKNES